MKNSEIELRQTDVGNGNNEPVRANGNSEPVTSNGNSQREPIHRVILQKIRAAITFLTIEPFLFCYVFPSSLSSIAVQRLNLEKACLVDLNLDYQACNEWDTNTTISVQSIIADMTSWQIPLQSSIPAIAIMFVGAWSDRTGNRKALMLIPMLGELISSLGLIATSFFFYEMPLYATALIESLPTALSGGFSIALMGAYSHLADVTTLEERTFRIGIAGVIVTLAAPLAISLSGILLEETDYLTMFGITSALYLAGLLYTYFRVHNVKQVPIEGTFVNKLRVFFDIKNPIDTFMVLIRKTPNRTKIILVIACHFVIIAPVFGEGAMQYQYMIVEHKMEDVEISLYFTYSILVGLCGTAVAVILFSKFLKMHDAIIGVIAATSKVVSNFVYGKAPTKQWYYSGPVFDFFGGAGVTALRSLATKIVEPEQIAKICSLMGLVEAIAPVIVTPAYSQTYKATIGIDGLHGAFYYLGSVMTIPAIALFVALYILLKRQERDVVVNPQDKERHAHVNNDVTAF